MKSNFAKYIFFIFVIGIMIFAIYKLNKEENKKVEETQGTGTSETATDDIIKEMNLGIAEFDTINPILSNNKYVQEISRIIYEPLLEVDEEYKISKCLAKDWAKTSGTTYLIKIDTNRKWSDGSNLTIEDILYTIDILKKTPSIYAYNAQYIVRADKIDDTSLQITIDHEIPFFEYNLIFPIMSKKYYEGQDFSSTEKNNMPISTGKYKITRNEADGITLEKNEYYSKELSLEKINIGKYSNLGELYNAFKLGKVDLITTTNPNITDYIGTIGYNISEAKGREYEFIAINTQSASLAYNEVRKAIQYGINRENIVATLYGSKYKITDYPLDYGNYLKGEGADTGYNKDNAVKILEENGWTYKYNRWQKTENYSTKTINLRLVVQASNQSRVTAGEIIKSNLEEIGMKTTLIKASDTQYQYYLSSKNYDMIITGTTENFSPNLGTYFGEENLANYNNEEVLSILNEVKNITKEDLLKEKYTRIRQIYNEEIPYIGLYSSYYAVASNWNLRGKVAVNWYNIFMDVDNWYKN